MRQWRSLAEAERDPAFLARAAQEFPSLAASLRHPVDRRRVLRLMGASLALAGLGGCDPASEDGQLVPAVVAPPDIVPGIANRYASVSLAGGSALGITVTQQMGRPIKVEGNPNHPASLGATDTFAQAELLDFYDPDRAIGFLQDGVPSDLPAFLTFLAARRAAWAAARGAGLRLLTGTVLSPTLARQIAALLARYPQAQWHQWDAIGRDLSRRGAVLAYGRPVDVVPHVAAADVIVGFESDLLSGAPGWVAHARGFASRRNPTRTEAMSRVYAIEPTPTLLGTAADHRIVAGPAELLRLLGDIAAGVLGGQASDARARAIVADLRAHGGRALLHAGADLPAEAHALVHAANEALGGRGTVFDVIDPAEPMPVDQEASLAVLMDDMQRGAVTDLVVLGTNPVFSQPAFARHVPRVPHRLVAAVAMDETAAAATWVVPATHAWESWSDARAFDGTASIIQPQALPLYDGVSPHTLLAWLAGPDQLSSRDIVRATWSLDAASWHDALARGVLPGTAHAPLAVALRPEAPAVIVPIPSAAPMLLCRPDPNLLDGRHANNPWLQELPRPLTKVTWDNPLLISPELARREALQNGHEVVLHVGPHTVMAPVFVVPGQAPEVIVAQFGYGRRVVGAVGGGTGTDMFPIRDAFGPVRIAKTGKVHRLATTDHHDVLAPSAAPDGIVRHIALADLSHGLPRTEDPYAAPSLYPARKSSAQAWAMSVDLNACIGCNACAVACQAENNVPTVGREQVLLEREMSWLRIDRYYEGDASAPDAYFQPMLCQHCEEAPCEVVCPVGATMHDDEGINVMVYNRCVGTRFCSNNCPYKVRRFNFGAYAREEHRPPISRNPDVTARARGVMEKCNYCLQRIAAARIEADISGRPIADGEVVTACQQACPTRAFTFGSIGDADSAVSKRKHSPLDYSVLPDQATRPRTTYEARVLNRNPAMPA